MYPHHYFGLFPPFPREGRVFVAMSFDDRFRSRWEKVIAMAIRSVRRDGVPLEPHRVDTSRISDSILTKILGGISNDQLIIADVTTLDHINGRAVRNGNVMYEIGLAHALRLPEEVLLFRSDSDPVLFDIANVKINSYDPENNPEGARKQVAKAIVEAFNEIDLKRHLAVKIAVQSLDATSRSILLKACAVGSIHDFPTRKMGQALGNAPSNAAIRRLLEIGALTAHNPNLIREFVGKDSKEIQDFLSKEFREILKYTPTQLGRAMFTYMVAEMVGFTEADELKSALEARIKEEEEV